MRLMEQLKRWPQTKLAFQPGTYQMEFGNDCIGLKCGKTR